MDYQTGDILHCTGHSLLSKIIMLATRSKFSHSALVISVWGKNYVVEAQAKGVYLIEFTGWQKKWNYKYIVHRSPNAINEKEFALQAMSKVGHTAYDFVGLLIKQPIELLTGRWKNRKGEDDKMYCSEYVAWCYGLNDFYRISPQDLYEWCLKNNFHEV